MRYGGRIERKEQEREAVKEMNISGCGGFYLAWQGLKVNLHQQSHLCSVPGLRREGEEKEEQQTRKIKAH